MIPSDVFRHLPTLHGERVSLEPLTVAVLEPYLTMLADPESNRLTGTTQTHDRATIERWLATRTEHHDRADWAAVVDGAFVGEAVLNELDPDHASANFRIGLAPHAVGRGLGTEITRLVVDHGFAVGLHRISLTVFAFNPRARRVYEKCGFVLEGRMRDAHHDADGWHDDLLMAVLSTDPRGQPLTS